MHIEFLTGRGELDDVYAKDGYLENFHRCPDQAGMRGLLAALRASPSPLQAFGMTHHHELGLRAVDDETAPELVSISTYDQYSFFISYVMPADQAPWPHAQVKGHATSVEEATEMVKTAFRLSEGWPDVLIE